MVKKKSVALPKLTETEQDLLSHIEEGYQLETDSLGGNPVLRRLKDNEEIRLCSHSQYDQGIGTARTHQLRQSS